MNECEETEEGVHPSETPLCGQHDNQTKAQSTPPLLVLTPSTSASAPVLGSLESLSSDLKKNVTISDDSSDSGQEQLHKPDSQVPSRLKACTGNLSRTASLSPRWHFRDSSSSDSKKDATADDISVLSSDSGRDHKCSFKTASAPIWLDFSESLFSHSLKDVATADRYSVLSLDSGISLERKVSSGSSCESGKKEKEKTTPPTTQELDVGSSAGIET